MKNLYFSNPKIDSQISKIKQKLMLSMNGIVSEQMEKNGIYYKQNFGVTIPRIKEIAAETEKNADLAERLWILDIRETKILSTLIEPVESMSIEKSLSRIQQINQIELAEQISMNLLSKLPYAEELCLICTCSNQHWMQITGFTLSTRIYERFTYPTAVKLIDKAFELAYTDEFLLYKSIATLLARLVRKGPEVTKYLLEKMNDANHIKTMSIEYISNELKQEIDFLNGF